MSKTKPTKYEKELQDRIAELEDSVKDHVSEIKRMVDLAHKAMGAREPNHQVSCRGLGREYLEELVVLNVVVMPEED